MCTSSVPRSKLIFDKVRVGEFCAKMLDREGWANYSAIGLERHGEIIAGAVYEGFTGTNMYVHLAGVPGRRWMTREFLYAGFRYPFVQLKAQRITAPVEASNEDALRLNRHLGFVNEAVLRGAMPSGDLILMVMWKERCRFIGE
jgi:RimJ/RimL family protein N-acetyltransferase